MRTSCVALVIVFVLAINSPTLVTSSGKPVLPLCPRVEGPLPCVYRRCLESLGQLRGGGGVVDGTPDFSMHIR